MILQDCTDERKNKVGRIKEDEIILLDFIEPWSKFKIILEESKVKIDILIKCGKTVDKSIIDIAILDDKIIEVKNQIDASKYQAKQIINLDGEKFISAGWIDIHTHCYERLDLYKDYPDEVGIKVELLL